VVLDDPRVPEDRRHCANCDSPVGRSHDGNPGRTEGFCRQCGHAFSFRPKLAAGDIVADQYEVAGCLAHGGLGWIYLAKDKNVVDRWVVLKGLLNTGDDDARTAALAERRFLAEVEHPNIVKIYNFVEHQDDGYIVMEFVDGTSLRDMLQERRAANGGAPDPLPVTQAIAYVLEILPAVGHLHDLGLLFCDFKPDNVMQCASSLKLIDLGGVYSVENPASAIFGTVGYQAPEIAQTGPTVASDLFTVARTLAVLCTNFRAYQTTYRHTLPDPTENSVLAAHESLYAFLQRATAANPDDRFQSADEMHAQLLGILREIVATETGTPAPGPSTLFTSEQRADHDAPDWRALPAPIVAADDPAAGFLATVAAGAPAITLDALRRAPEHTVEVDLRIARTLLEAGSSQEASEVLDAIDAIDPWEWRTHWYRGLDRLVQGDPQAATPYFQRVYRELPGELAAKLGLAVAAESSGNITEAVHWYDIVSRTDPSMTSACFGLARCRLALDDREGALAAFDRVPDRSNAHVAALTAKAQALLHSASPMDLMQSAELVQRAALTGEPRAQLTARIFEAGLQYVFSNGISDPNPPSLLAHPLNETGMRRGLESSYRALARYSESPDERIQLVDRANRVRPRTLV
jgi:serine/threonine-protein kinase PknG